MNDAPRLLRVADVAALLACSKVAIYRGAEAGRIPAYRVAGVGWRFSKDEIMRWIEAQKNTPRAR